MRVLTEILIIFVVPLVFIFGITGSYEEGSDQKRP